MVAGASRYHNISSSSKVLLYTALLQVVDIPTLMLLRLSLKQHEKRVFKNLSLDIRRHKFIFSTKQIILAYPGG